eukprot:1231032-Prymnesium_polylepis.1
MMPHSARSAASTHRAPKRATSMLLGSCISAYEQKKIPAAKPKSVCESPRSGAIVICGRGCRRAAAVGSRWAQASQTHVLTCANAKLLRLMMLSAKPSQSTGIRRHRIFASRAGGSDTWHIRSASLTPLDWHISRLLRRRGVADEQGRLWRCHEEALRTDRWRLREGCATSTSTPTAPRSGRMATFFDRCTECARAYSVIVPDARTAEAGPQIDVQKQADAAEDAAAQKQQQRSESVSIEENIR